MSRSAAGPGGSEPPATGPRVINTRPDGQNAGLSALLRKSGFAPLEIPLIAITADEKGLEKLRKLAASGFTGIFLSSPNGLRQLAAALDPAALARWTAKPFYLVGPKSRPEVEALGGRVAFVPEQPSLQGFLEEFKAQPGPAGLPMMQRWLHPCSLLTKARPEAFRERGVEVENVPVYRPGFPEDAAARLAEAGEVSAILFCSGSAVENFYQAAPEAMAKAVGAPKGILAISIGPSTTEALRARGVEPHEAPHADNEGLLDALRRAYGGSETRIMKKGR
jgi:uroporphyrinogen-III synthase